MDGLTTVSGAPPALATKYELIRRVGRRERSAGNSHPNAWGDRPLIGRPGPRIARDGKLAWHTLVRDRRKAASTLPVRATARLRARQQRRAPAGAGVST